jgi:acrylyl-CoA reductase (NADPH)
MMSCKEYLMNETFRAYRVELDGEHAKGSVQQVGQDVLPPHPVTVRVAYSSLNYKDALSATGHKGVTRNYPHTPGIDAAGTVVASDDSRITPGDEVIVTSYDLGMNTPGGFGQLIRVPADWVVPLPEGLTLRDAMILGTAGFTAALAVDALERHDLRSDAGPVVVTGASGGVGSLAVALLAKLGYEVTASTGSQGAHGMLKALGATHIISRQELSEPSKRPLLTPRWAGAVDTVGGHTLEQIIKTLEHGGSVAACGLVGGVELSLTVYPFILRGANLLGVDSAECPVPRRRALWRKLANEWKLGGLERITTEVELDGLDKVIKAILTGQTQGRVLVNLRA